MYEASFEETLERIRNKDQRFARDAYQFVREALDHTQNAVSRENRGPGRHVTGQELLEGIREFALSQFGPMAMTILEEWGIHCCQDFGDIVFNMIDAGLLLKTDQDTPAAFAGGYDFYEAFRRPFLPSSRQTEPAPAVASPSAA